MIYDGWKMKIYSPSIMPTHYCYTPTSPNWWHLSSICFTIHLFHPNCTHKVIEKNQGLFHSQLSAICVEGGDLGRVLEATNILMWWNHCLHQQSPAFPEIGVNNLCKYVNDDQSFGSIWMFIVLIEFTTLRSLRKSCQPCAKVHAVA